MTQALIYFLAGMGCCWLILMTWTIVVSTVSNWQEKRRLDRLTDRLIRREYDEIAPIDLMKARKRWPGIMDEIEHQEKSRRSSANGVVNLFRDHGGAA